MRRFFIRKINFRNEPHSMTCPKCSASMNWNSYQGPMGGWTCPSCGLKIDYK